MPLFLAMRWRMLLAACIAQSIVFSSSRVSGYSFEPSCSDAAKEILTKAIADAVDHAQTARDRLREDFDNPEVHEVFQTLFPKSEVGHVIDVFQNVSVVDTQAPWLTIDCGDSHLIYRRPGRVAKFLGNKNHGQWYDQTKKVRVGKAYKPGDVELSDPENPLRPCDTRIHAQVFNDRASIIVCPSLLGKKWRGQGEMMTFDARAAKYDCFLGENILYYGDLPGPIMLHELTHTKLLGKNATDDVDYIEDGKLVTAYGFKRCKALADLKRIIHLRMTPQWNADSYRWLAVALYCYGYNWKTGFAQPNIYFQASGSGSQNDTQSQACRPQPQPQSVAAGEQ
ncbi:MAG: hypothetical protein M1825_004666 [Sarcosagium campestre]|nr:MAG: hypothetical protein M1825_004666 [Sarcosagium campestre]